MASEKIQKAAVIGLGSIGRRHARNLTALGVEPWGYDPSAEARAAAQREGIAAYDDAEVAIAAADCILICTPTQYHADDLARALAHGKPIMVEKPIAHRLSAVPALNAQQRDSVFVAYNLRYNPAIRAARSWLNQGSVGRIDWIRIHAAMFLPDWRPHTDYRRGYAADPVGGGALLDFSHEFDLALHLFGPASVSGALLGRSPRLGLSTEDCAEVLLQFTGGAIGTVHVDYCSKPIDRWVEAAGENGRLRIDLIRRKAEIRSADDSVLHTFSAENAADADYIAEVADFLAAARGQAGSGILCTAEQAMESLQIIENAKRLCSPGQRHDG
jgi:predicted dehydrogenase